MPYYELPPPRPKEPGDGAPYIGAAVGALGAMLLAFAMVPLRDHLDSASMALALVLPVLVAAIIGGRMAGTVSAIVAALSFNFVFTKPYLSLRIASGDEIATFVTLTIVGLIVSELAARARRGSLAARQARAELGRMYRIADLSSRGADLDDVVSSVRAEMIGLFDLVDCIYEPTASGPELPRLGHRGEFEHTRLIATREFLLPTGTEIPVRGRGRAFGRIVLHAANETPAPLEKRLVAVAIADELGAALAGRLAG